MYFSEVDGQWVGMIGAYRDEKQKISHILHVVSFYVLPNFRGQGIGKALLREVINQAKQNPGVKKLELGVIATQATAFQLYLAMGFEKIGSKQYAVKVGEQYFTEYLMEKILE